MKQNFSKQRQLILASSSRRRREILRSIGIRHKSIPSRIKEKTYHQIGPVELVIDNAKAKSWEVARKIGSGLVLGVDTVVLFKNEIIGKPKDKDEARALLAKFSGQKIYVYTGMYLIDIDFEKRAWCFDETELSIDKIKQENLGRYLALLAPFDKAGGFSIEGAGSLIFDNIKGSYFNVLGLPMMKLAQLFENIGLDLLDFIE